MKKEYETLRKKYNLQEFNELNRTFDIGELESEDILREIRKKIVEKINSYTKFLEGLLQPDTSTSGFFECDVLSSDKEKKKLFDLYKKLMIIDRSSLLVSLASTDEEEAKFINETYKEWNNLKEELINLITLVKESWKKNTTIKTEEEYFG